MKGHIKFSKEMHPKSIEQRVSKMRYSDMDWLGWEKFAKEVEEK